MKKLKTISKYSIYILLLIIIYSLIYTNLYTFKSKYKGNEKQIIGYVNEIKNKSYIIYGKEKIIVKFNKNKKINYNDLILAKGYIKKPYNNTIFNSFNYKKYLNNNKIYYIFYASDIKIIKHNNNIFFKLKNNIYNRINTFKTKKYLKVFILGDKSDIVTKEKNVYKNLGIIHLLSISGTYISIMILFLHKLLKIKNKNIIISIFLLFYIALTNFQISIIRSSVCYILFLINKKYLNIENKNIILLFASFLLLINPFYINDIGFLLSFIISYSLIYFNQLYKDNNYFKKAIVISLISFFTSLPIIINNYYSINLLSILINIIFVPYASFILFPMSFLTYIFPFLDNIYNLLIIIFNKASIILNDFKLLTFSFSKIPIVLILIYYYFLFTKKNKIIVLLIIIFYFYNYYIFYPRIYFLDVGQGDSALIRIKNKNILIDSGGNKYDNTDNYIMSFRSLGVKQIDYMFISHGDQDHIGNSIKYIKKIKIKKIYINKYKKTDLEKKLCKYKCNQIGDENILSIANTNFYILNPLYDMNNENDNSLVINFSIKNKNILFMGDVSSIVEERLINDYNLGKIDILKVGHHGSKTSSSELFINEINPKYSIISVGKENRYGHPNKEVLDNLKESKIYRTDKNGSIIFKIKNNRLKIVTCES